jgi:hypothetical protein
MNTRLGLLSAVFGLAALTASCSEDSLGIADMLHPDLSMPDLAEVADMTLPGDFAGVTCGTMTCGAGSICCITPTGGTSVKQMCTAPSACLDGGIQASCDGPEDCPSTGGSCCVTVNLLGGLGGGVGDAGAGVAGGAALCTTDCPGGLDADNAFHSRLCRQASDCANYMGVLLLGLEPFDKCCTGARLTQHACVPQSAVSLLRLTCL